jgi:hypothetical protein
MNKWKQLIVAGHESKTKVLIGELALGYTSKRKDHRSFVQKQQFQRNFGSYIIQTAACLAESRSPPSPPPAVFLAF